MSVEIPMMPPPEQQVLHQLAACMGVDLPRSYVDFVSRHDGATPQSNSLVVGANNASSVRQFVAVADAPTVLSEVEGFPGGMLPLAEDECGNFVYIDPSEGGVFFWDTKSRAGPSSSEQPNGIS